MRNLPSRDPRPQVGDRLARHQLRHATPVARWNHDRIDGTTAPMQAVVVDPHGPGRRLVIAEAHGRNWTATRTIGGDIPGGIDEAVVMLRRDGEATA